MYLEIAKFLILFVHGGFWFSTSTVFIADISPLFDSGYQFLFNYKNKLQLNRWVHNDALFLRHNSTLARLMLEEIANLEESQISGKTMVELKLLLDSLYASLMQRKALELFEHVAVYPACFVETIPFTRYFDIPSHLFLLLSRDPVKVTSEDVFKLAVIRAEKEFRLLSEDIKIPLAAPDPIVGYKKLWLLPFDYPFDTEGCRRQYQPFILCVLEL